MTEEKEGKAAKRKGCGFTLSLSNIGRKASNKCLIEIQFSVHNKTDFIKNIVGLNYFLCLVNLGVIPMKNSKFIPGIGRESTER